MIFFLGITHIFISIALFLQLQKFIELDRPIVLSVLFLVIGSIMADIDSKNSLIGRYTPFHLFLKHRGLTHTFIGAIIFSLPVLYYDRSYGIIFLIGYISHLLSDMLTPMGVSILYPLSKKRYSLNLVKVGSSEEYGVMAILVLYIFYSVEGLM